MSEFENSYIADLLIYSPSFENYKELEYSNKVILNQKILKEISPNEMTQSPMIFKISNTSELGYYETFVSVHDFTASDDKIYIPYRIADELLVERNQVVRVDYYVPPKGHYIKIKPLQKEFYNIVDIKDYLSNHIQKYYPVLHTGTTISIPHYDNKIDLKIIKCEPFDVISTVDTDISVEFEPFDKQTSSCSSTNMNQQERIHNDANSELPNESYSEWFPFCGKGYRLGNK